MPKDATEATKILIVDDEPAVCKLVKVNLESRGFVVDAVSGGTEAIRYLKQKQPDVIILDLVMPDIDGIDVCIWIRAQSDVPVIVLSAHDEEDLMIRALNAGADDYVTKPFSPPVLVARLQAILRRAAGRVQREVEASVEIDDLTIDLEARRVFVGGVDIQLTGTEFALLSELARNLDGVVTHEELLVNVWGPEYRDESHYLYIYMGRIRDKLGTRYRDLLETVSGVGYTLHSSPLPLSL
ncbi:MAG: response regulator transcription factor [Anaerolineae bacterium]|nr:response regulator transcription factor [Anaerolineae bacterium]